MKNKGKSTSMMKKLLWVGLFWHFSVKKHHQLNARQNSAITQSSRDVNLEKYHI